MTQDQDPSVALNGGHSSSLARRTLPLALAVFTLVLLSILAFIQISDYENSRRQDQFKALAETRAVAVQRGIDGCEGLLESIEGLYEATDIVSREMFAVFVRGALTGFSGVQALVFSPKIDGAQRQEFELAVRREGFPDFTITEKDRDGKMVPAGQRSQYFPVYLVEPFQNNVTALGFDLASDPTRFQALTRSQDNAAPASTGRLTLVTETGGQFGFMIFRPIYKKNAPRTTLEERRENLAGFAVGVFRAGMLMESALASIPPSGLDTWLIDQEAPENERVLNFHPSRLRSGQAQDNLDYLSKGLMVTIPLNIPGQNWALHFAATPAFLAGHPIWRPWLALGCGLAIALMLGLYLRKSFNHYCLIEATAKERAEATLALQEKISQLGLAQMKTRESEERLQVILKGMRAGIFTINASDSSILDLNPRAEELFGISRDDWLGRNFQNLLEDGSCHAFPRELPDASAIPSLVEVECLVKNPSGATVPMSRLTLSQDNQDNPLIYEVFFDISEKKALERQLTLSQKLESIGQLAAGIAHEINTPIQYVSSNLVFVRDSLGRLLNALGKCRSAMAKPSPETAKEANQTLEDPELDFLVEEIPKALGDCLEGVDRVTSIVLSIKKFAHPGNDEKTPVNINAAIETTVQVARNEWKYVADVQLNLNPDLPQVSCVPGELNQVLLNILVNAAQAIGQSVGTSGEKGKITITTRQQGDYVEISVADTGCGIPETNRSRVYDPFFTTKEVGQGTGQGLAIVFSVVKKHGGTVNFISQENKGTTFVVRLPITDPTA